MTQGRLQSPHPRSGTNNGVGVVFERLRRRNAIVGADSETTPVGQRLFQAALQWCLSGAKMAPERRRRLGTTLKQRLFDAKTAQRHRLHIGTTHHQVGISKMALQLRERHQPSSPGSVPKKTPPIWKYGIITTTPWPAVVLSESSSLNDIENGIARSM